MSPFKKSLGDERAAELARKFGMFMQEKKENGKLQIIREKYEEKPGF